MRVTPVAYGAFAVVLAVLAAIPSLRPAGWSVTALPRVGANTPMATAAYRVDPSFRVVDQGSYDGQFYWGIAVDPVARGDVHAAFDNPPYRYGHPLFGWLGWLASAGQASAAAAALLAVGLLAMFVAAAAAAALGRGLEALFVALNPGLLYAASHDLAEPLCAALLLLALNAYVRERRTLLLVCLALLPLAKEPLILVTAALVVRRRDVRLAATALPAVAWWVYARLMLGDWFTAGDNGLGVPFRGWVRALVDAGVDSYNGDAGRNQLGQAALVVFVALLGLLAFAAVRALRFRTPIDLAYLALAAVAACLAPIATVLLRDALRNTAVLLVLVPFVGTMEYSGRWSTRL